MATGDVETRGPPTLLRSVVDYLEAVNTRPAVAMIKDPANLDRVKDAAWDLVPLLCNMLTSERELEAMSVLNACEDILQHLSEVGNAKELLIVLLEQADTFKDDIKFKALLQPIQKCLQRLPSRRGNPLGIALETLYAHMETLPLPEDYEFDDSERPVLEADPTVQRICSCVSAFLGFLRPFAEEVSVKKRCIGAGDIAPKAANKQVKELTLYMIKLLCHPLVYLDLCSVGSSTSRSRDCAKTLVTFLSYLHADLHKALVQILADNAGIEREQKREQRKDSNKDELEKQMAEPVPMLGLGTIAYLVFGEKLCADNVPCVYRLEYLFEFNLPFVNVMLEKGESVVRLKGVSLFVSLLERMAPLTLSAHLLEFSPMKQLLQNLLHVIVYCPPKDIRQTAVKGLSCLLQKFDLAGRYRLLHILLKSSSHAGVTGYVIQLLKNEIDRSLKSTHPTVYFRGPRLEKLLTLVFALPDGVETDLLDQSETIMAALNLLRYLVLRNKPTDDATGVWRHVPRIQQAYCEPLQTAINMSHAHYALDIERTNKGEDTNDSSLDATLSVGDRILPELDQEQRVSVMATALYTFDMMQSILSRVTELIDMQQRSVLTEAA